MNVRMPPRFGLSAAAAAGAAMVAMHRTAPNPAAANRDVLIMSALRFGCQMSGVFCLPSSVIRHPSSDFAARHPVAGADLPKLRTEPAAALDRDRATRMKHAAGRRIDRARHLPFHRPEAAAGLDARIR